MLMNFTITKDLNVLSRVRSCVVFPTMKYKIPSSFCSNSDL